MLGAYFIADEFGNIEQITFYKIVGAFIIIGSLVMYLKESNPMVYRKRAKRKRRV